jgi:hypothetical protein
VGVTDDDAANEDADDVNDRRVGETEARPKALPPPPPFLPKDFETQEKLGDKKERLLPLLAGTLVVVVEWTE